MDITDIAVQVKELQMVVSQQALQIQQLTKEVKEHGKV